MTHPANPFDADRIAATPGASATAQVADSLALYGYEPEPGEVDPRPFPDTEALDAMAGSIVAAFAEPVADTALATELGDLLWSLVDLFHRKADRVQRQLDDNEQRQRTSHEEQDGSEIRSVELERLIVQGRDILERRAAFEHLRDRAGEHYEAMTGAAWRPRSGSKVNHRALTAAVIDSREFISAKRRAETEVLLPAGPKIVFTGGVDCNDHDAIWATLDKVVAKHPEMVLLHGGTDRGAERIAACWADARKVTQIAFKPDWTRDGKAAPFKRNDRMLDILPLGVVAFAGSGITDNLVDKAKKLGIAIVDRRTQATRAA